MTEAPRKRHDGERPELYRRRRQPLAHRRKSMFVALVRPLLTALMLVATPAAAAYWAATTPYLEIGVVEVSGTERVSEAWVREALAGLHGEHILRTGFDEVWPRLASHEWIRDVALRKELPDCLHVLIEERHPAAILRLRGELWFVERDATVIARYDPSLENDRLLILDAPVGSRYELVPALDLAAAWRRANPPWSGPIVEIEIVSEEDFRVHTADLDFPVLASPGALEPGLERLSWLLPELDRRYEAIASVDIRYSRQIVFQPAARPQTEEG